MLRVERVQGLVTVQDLGREGVRALGVPTGGAMDRVALRLANALVGNPDGAAGIEIAHGSLSLELISGTAVAAVAGPDGPVTLDGRPIEPGTAATIRAGQALVVSPPARGRFRYLAIRGGINVESTLGSRSTYLPTGWGGFRGRSLQPGDLLAIGEPSESVGVPTEGLAPVARNLPAGWSLLAAPAAQGMPVPFRIAGGPQSQVFPPAAGGELADGEYRVLPASDRMGARLAGPAVPVVTHASLPSEGTVVGAIQIPDDGQPIVLLRDGPTVGGYPKIGAVISADLDRFCQAAPGETVTFRWVSLPEAARARRERDAALDACLRAIRATGP